ncbi:hypothetical protein L596_019395 [Steinernema carpocapsae]|uniref:N-acetyltransferase domain-containing protein n=1 Tax=Steinernema carpocapsae TaxID=34508 RepID=A0A4U5MQX7_STECR|nr:hypothetical protein L596_019395 [Steinernema carpocapsae]
MHGEDTIILPESRRLDLGYKLIASECQYAKKHNLKAYECFVASGNRAAVEFMKKLRSTNLTKTDGWMRYRMGEEEIADCAKMDIYSKL